MKPFTWNSIEELIEKLNRSPFYRTVSMELIKIDKKGSLVRIRSNRKHKNYLGTIHGGALATLLDATCGTAGVTYLKNAQVLTTISLSIDYLAPAVKGDLIGRGKVVHCGRRLIRTEGIVVDEGGRLIARGYGSFMILEKN
jgi:uncharacterized protein (TIGR00369 family)